MFELVYHPDSVDEISQLPDVIRGKMTRLLDMLEKRGNELRYPLSKPVREGLFELRASGKDIARTLYVFQSNREIFILRCFIKKIDKTPLKEVKLALQRLEEMIDE